MYEIYSANVVKNQCSIQLQGRENLRMKNKPWLAGEVPPQIKNYENFNSHGFK